MHSFSSCSGGDRYEVLFARRHFKAKDDYEHDKSHDTCPFWRRPRVIACAGLVLLVCVVLIFSALRSKTPAQNTDKPALVTGSEEPTRAFSASTLPSDTGDPTLHEIVSTQGETKPYTVMVYMVGSNLESRFGAATRRYL
jgi:hypothetical protein